MADVTIKDEGVTIDLEQITIEEYIDFAEGKLLNKADFKLVARLTGKSEEWVRTLSQIDYRRVVTAVFKKASEPLSDPN